ncbi:PEP-CTERM sorting domain-containing protein [Planctomycetota bacterium]|nr:PEP-CTERM sorting domain-containing protein [Planctomycetota bacterium]
MKLACVLIAILAFSLQITATAATIDPYIDDFVSFTPGSNTLAPHNEPIEAFGAPDGGVGAAGGYLSLGNNGEVILEFTDNLLIDGTGFDIRLYEIGDPDPYTLLISHNNIDYYTVGSGTISRSFDISSVVTISGQTAFRYVKVIDNNAFHTPSPFAGTDIDSIEALHTIPIPEPASLALLSLGSLAMIRRRK